MMGHEWTEGDFVHMETVIEKRGCRSMSREMIAAGWFPISGDSILWCHEPSGRCVNLDDRVPRKTANYDSTATPCLHGEPADPATVGYTVCVSLRDEHGNPIEGDAFWVESYGEALTWAMKCRQSILDEQETKRKSVSVVADQGNLFE